MEKLSTTEQSIYLEASKDETDQAKNFYNIILGTTYCPYKCFRRNVPAKASNL